MDEMLLSSKQTLRHVLVRIAKWVLGCFYICIGAPGYRTRIITFVFHEVSDKPNEHAKLTKTYSREKTFLKQISILKSNFNIVTARSCLESGGSKKCLITFDDGYKSSLKVAKILEIDGIPSTHFINLETVYGQVNSSALLHYHNFDKPISRIWSKSTPSSVKEILEGQSSLDLKRAMEFGGPYLNLEDLGELKSLQSVVVGDHFLNHWFADSLDEDEVLRNLATNDMRYPEAKWIDSLFAAPHGKMSENKMQIICNAGYEMIFSGNSWRYIGGVRVLPRIDMNDSIKSKVTLFGSIALLIIRSKREVGQ